MYTSRASCTNFNESIQQLSASCTTKLCQINRVKHVFNQVTLLIIINLDVWPLSVENEALLTCNLQFHLIVASVFLKTCVKDHGDGSGRLLERTISLVCIEALLLAVL